jgi:hypothetical protein
VSCSTVYYWLVGGMEMSYSALYYWYVGGMGGE